MSDVTRTTRPAPLGDEKRKDDSTGAGASWMPGWLRGAGLDKQEEALKPGNQPGFEEQEAARRPEGGRGKGNQAAADKGNADETKEAAPARPAFLKYITPGTEGRTSTSIIVSPGARKGLKAGEVVSWGHVQGVVDEVWEFRAKVTFPVGGGQALLKELLGGYGGMIDFGPPRQAAPGTENDEQQASADAPKATPKRPLIVARPGTPKVKRMSAGHAAKQEVANVSLNVYFGLAGQKLETAVVEYSGSFENADIVREVLESLKRAAAYDVKLMESDLTDADLMPHAEKIARIIQSAK